MIIGNQKKWQKKRVARMPNMKYPCWHIADDMLIVQIFVRVLLQKRSQIICIQLTMRQFLASSVKFVGCCKALDSDSDAFVNGLKKKVFRIERMCMSFTVVRAMSSGIYTQTSVFICLTYFFLSRILSRKTKKKKTFFLKLKF